MRKITMWIIALSIFVVVTDALNVLVFLPGAHRYERRGLERVAQYLALKHHGVVTFKAVLIPEEKQLIMPKLHLVEELALRDLVPRSISDELKNVGNDPDFWKCGNQPSTVPTMLDEGKICQTILNSDLLDRIRSLRMDLAIVKPQQDCYLGIVEKLRIPFIYYDTNGFSEDTALVSGSPLLLSEIPPTATSYDITSEMTLKQKAVSLGLALRTYFSYLSNGINALSWLNPNENVITQAFLQLENHSEIISPSEIKRRAALFFVNSDPIIEPKMRAISQNLVYVAGAHMEYPRPLFPPWNETIALAPDGVIVVSFGEFINASTMPEEATKSLLHVFRSLPSYRVFWRIKSHLPTGIRKSDIPRNVNFTQFLPQADLLGDKNTKLLITHGGMDSVVEALHLGVPMLGIPLFEPNYNTLRKVEALGVAKIVDKCSLTKDSLNSGVREMLKNRYRLKAKEVSSIIKNRPMDGFETAVHWIETVARYPSMFNTKPRSIYRQFFADIASTEIGFTMLAACAALLLRLQLWFLGWLARGYSGDKRKVNKQQPSSDNSNKDNLD